MMLFMLFFQSKTYMCSWQGDTLCFTVDFALGFTCFDSKTKVRGKRKENITLLYFSILEVISNPIFYTDVQYFFLKHTVLFVYIAPLKCSQFGTRKG